jgi:uncharacterized phage protein gp47/JayE
MAFQKTFDELLNDLLTDYRNQLPEADTAQGSLIFIKSAATASALWGLYQALGYLADQIFPDTADSASLEHHAYIRGLARKVGETDADLLARLLDYIRRPPAGGNKYDYVKWALAVTGVKAAYCIPEGQGPGSVDVVIVADAVLTGSEIPDAELLAAVKAYIDDVRPVTAKYTRALAAEFVEQDVAMAVSGANVDRAQIALDIAAYLGSFVPGQVLYPAQLITIAVTNGADGVNLATPAGIVTPTTSQVLRPGVIDVT